MTTFIRHGIAALLLMLHIGMVFGAEAQVEASAAASAPIPYKREEAAPAGSLSRLVAGLAVCGLVLGGVLYLLKRHGRIQGMPGARRKHIELLETQRLGPRAALHAVRFANSVYLLAQSEQGITTVAAAEAQSADTGKELA